MPSSNGQRAERDGCECSALGQYGVKLHCRHFNGQVIHWHEGDDLHSVCGPDNAVQAGGGLVVHLSGEAEFDNGSAAEAEFARRELALMGRESP